MRGGAERVTHTFRKAVVIDDESLISDLVSLLLTKLGFKVKCASDGELGLRLVKREKPDLLVTDMLLPKLHGLEICKAVRSNSALLHTRIIAMTAIYKKLKFRLEARDVRVDAYVEKPFDVKEFTNVILGLFPGEKKDDELKENIKLVRKTIEKQTESFAGKLPDTLDVVTRLWNRYQLDQENPGDLDELRKHVHGLTGSAALCGFHEVSRICRQLEKTLSDIEENGGAIIKSQQAEIANLIALLPDAGNEMENADSPPLSKDLLLSSEATGDYRNSEIPVTIISMNPHNLEEFVKGLASFGYKANLVRFGELGRKGFSFESGNVVLDLQKRPSGTAWMKKLDVCQANGPLNVVAMAGEQGPEPGRGKLDSPEFCWKWLTWPVDAYDVTRRLEEDEKFVRVEEPYRLLIVMREMAMSEHFQILLRQKGFLATVCERSQMFASVREFQPDVILLDMQQEFQRTIALMRISRAWRQETPIIVSGDSFSPDEMKGLKEEMVSDVVSTGSPFELLAFSLESHARCGRRMRDSRTQDFLSGVHQYSSFMEAMETELKWASRSGRPMSVAVFGLDNVIELASLLALPAPVFEPLFDDPHPVKTTAVISKADATDKYFISSPCM